MTDPLTGLMNRRRFATVVKAKLKEAVAQNRNAAFIMLDVDHFKSINDSHGHDAGDGILKQLAEELQSSFRSSDLICRWGGEEFLAYVDDADAQTAKTLAARLQARLAKREFLNKLTRQCQPGHRHPAALGQLRIRHQTRGRPALPGKSEWTQLLSARLRGLMRLQADHRPWGMVKSSAGPLGTMPVGLMSLWLP